MMTLVRSTIRAAVLATLTFAVRTELVNAQLVLRQIDSVVVKETDAVILARIAPMAISPRGDIFETDPPEGRVIQIARNGAIVRTFGRKGQGPGELTRPSSLVVFADSLFVRSAGRISVFDINSGKFVRSFNATLSSFASIKFFDNQLVALSIDPKTFAPLVVLSPTGDLIKSEGVMPAIIHENPKLAGAVVQLAAASRGNDVWGANEFTQSLVRWKRGTTVAVEELKLPVVKRRGVNPEDYLQMLRDPSKAAKLAYNHSFPMALNYINPDILGLLTLDPAMDEKGEFSGSQHLTLVDTKTKRVCADIVVPVAVNPVPQLALKADTLITLEQGSSKDDDVVAYTRRFHINLKQCTWKPL